MKNWIKREIASGRVAKWLLVSLLLSVPAKANEEPPTPEVKESGHSIAPVVGYDPTYKLVLGAAYFYKTPTLAVGLDANTNFRKVYQFHYSYKHSFAGFWEHGLKGGVHQGFDPFYGEGGDTKAVDYSQIWGQQTNNRAHIGLKFSEFSTVGAFLDLRTRTETAGDKSPPSRVAPDESTASLGVFYRIDTRSVLGGPKEGFSFGFFVTHSPSEFTSVKGTTGFTQAEGDFIVYKEILNHIIPDVIAAFCLKGGYTFGTPTYAFAYRLGGANELRGFFDNRFRGKKYYLQQTELRFPLLHPVGGAAFIGFGDATNTDFTDAKMSYGIGLRIALPPDWISQVRLDFGFAKDQWGMFANFGQVF